jgi:hypothetical protein
MASLTTDVVGVLIITFEMSYQQGDSDSSSSIAQRQSQRDTPLSASCRL